MRRRPLIVVTLVLAWASAAAAQTTQPFRQEEAAALFRDAILAKPEDSEAVPHLIYLLETIGPEAVPVVEELWLKQHAGYRERAFQCLANIHRTYHRDSRAYEALVRIIGNEKGDAGFRARAIRLLVQDSVRTDDRFYAALLVAYKSFAVVEGEGTPVEDTLHHVAFGALYRHGRGIRTQAPAICRMLTDPAMTDTVEKLDEVMTLVGRCGSEATPVVPALKEMFADANRPTRIRLSAASALAQIAVDTERDW